MKLFFLNIFVLVVFSLSAQKPGKYKTGDKAPDFEIQSLNNEQIYLSDMYKKGPVVFLVLRGWPQYQCPICTRQVGQFIGLAGEFSKLGATILLLYPAPKNLVNEKAGEFIADFLFPANVVFTLDPDFKIINKYGLRWDAKRETSYPSTFVIDNNGKIVWSKTSTSHGGRSKPYEVLKVLKEL